MPKIAVLKKGYINTFNKRFFLSARINSDVRGNICQCGGKFTESETFKGYDIPACNKCGENPNKLRIRANVIDINGAKKRIEIRHNQLGERLTDVIECMATLRVIKQELDEGSFDIRKYQSEEDKEGFIFKNFLEVYVKFHEKRYKKGEITIEGLRDKKKSHPHLLKYFGDVNISKLRKMHIARFEDEFDGSANTLRKCKSELKTILNYAIRKELIFKLPELGVIGKSNLREHTMTEEVGIDIISHIKNEKYQDMIMLLTIYPIRPGEIRALKWGGVDLKKNTITFNQHFSGGDDIGGRKSRKEGERLSSITLNLSILARKIILKQPRNLNPNSYVFQGAIGNSVSHTALNDAWTKARDLAGYIPDNKNKYHMYELKHIRLSQMNDLVNGDLKVLEEASGVDVKTLMDRYVKANKEKVNSFFQ